MSVAYGSSTDCGVHPDGSSNWLVQPFGGSTGIKIEEVFGPSATVRFQKAAQDHIQDANDENCKPETIDTSDWSLSHAQGRWRVKGYATTHRLCGYYEDFDLNLNPPERITGPQFGSDKMDWGRLSRSMPDVNVLDAVIAPDQSWGALLVGPPCKTPQKNCDLSRSLQIYQFENGRPAKKISTTKVTIGAEIVMAEWALGKNADRWDETMGKLPVSPPTVQFDPPDSHK